MLNHILLLKLSDPTKRDFCIGELDTLRKLDSVSSIIVKGELGAAPNRWDIAVVSQHRDAEQLEAFRVDEFHKAVGSRCAEFVEAMSCVDFEATEVTVA